MHITALFSIFVMAFLLNGCSTTGLTKEGTTDKNVKVSNYDRIKTRAAAIEVILKEGHEYFNENELKNRVNDLLQDKGIKTSNGPIYTITIYKLQANGFAKAPGAAGSGVGSLIGELLTNATLNAIRDDPVKWNWGYKISKDGEELTDFYYHSLICPPDTEQAMDTITSIMGDTIAEFFERN
ncbi:hypothetical protein [Thiomicrorhabdus sp.]|uniref:hypothetical protein n=1 Tax=Thiomicrorhabdus sp. TaxID=2039724 RepID=UPI0029C7B9EB|nr:hypothetical protein [Thiomicrorhabdus sp.]